jgi:hypothetical protein
MTRSPRPRPLSAVTGFPRCAFAGHGPAGSGEPPSILLRPSTAGSNTAAGHEQVSADALAQLPSQPGYRVRRKVLVRTDTAGGTHEFLDHLHQRRLTYSVPAALPRVALSPHG